MKTLYVVRHAKSSWDNPGLNDFDRPLNDRGEKDAPRMGKRLKECDIKPEIIYSSPAVRAFSTAQSIAQALDIPLTQIKTEKRLYHASEETLLDVLKHSAETADCVMLVGHNPGLTEFVNDLLDEDIDNIPTTGVVMAQLPIHDWKDARWKCGNLLLFDYPKRKK